MVVCASPALIAAHGTPKALEDLSALPCVAFETAPATTSWTFRRPGGAGPVSVAITPRLAVSTAEAAVEAAARGVGATRVFTYQCADAVRAGALMLVLRDFEPDSVPVHFVHAGRAALPLKMRVFLDFATTRLRKAMGELERAMA